MSSNLPEANAAIIDAWNATVPVGTPVTLVKDLGERVESRTKGPAYMLGGDPVVYVEGAGPWLLGRVIPNVKRLLSVKVKCTAVDVCLRELGTHFHCSVPDDGGRVCGQVVDCDTSSPLPPALGWMTWMSNAHLSPGEVMCPKHAIADEDDDAASEGVAPSPSATPPSSPAVERRGGGNGRGA